MSAGAQRFFLDVAKIRALVRDNPQMEAAPIRQALADYDAYEAAGEAPLLWIERNQLVVGTLHSEGPSDA